MASEVLRRKFRQRIFAEGYGIKISSQRKLSSGEVATALRPFYFSVHPDLFGKYPTERATNENSLQLLSSYLQNLQQKQSPRPTKLTFFLRPQGTIIDKGSLKTVSIMLVQPDIKKTVVSILSTCDLPTTYVDNLTPPVKIPPNRRTAEEVFRRKHNFHAEQNINVDAEAELRTAKKIDNLFDWLKENVSSSREKLAALEPLREEIDRLQAEICEEAGLSEVLWECGWNIAHFRGCLLSFRSLLHHHRQAMDVLRGRTLVFSNITGVSLDRKILLNSGEVRNNWLDFIKNVRKQDLVLITVPTYEKALSTTLRDIQVVRRKFQPYTMAKDYEERLMRLTTSLNDYWGQRGYPKTWPESLSDYELVVETESGPMMVSPTGQFIVPCSCPSFLIVNFITEHVGQAAQFLEKYRSLKEVEKSIHKECLQVLGLISLDKDDCITPELMITCLTNLLAHKSELYEELKGIRLSVTSYYSIMSDGQMCIPWNWNK